MSKTESRALLRDAVLAWMTNPKRKRVWVIASEMLDYKGTAEWQLVNNAMRRENSGMECINLINGASWTVWDLEWALKRLTKEGWLHAVGLEFGPYGAYALASHKDLIARDAPKWEAEARGEHDENFRPFQEA